MCETSAGAKYNMLNRLQAASRLLIRASLALFTGVVLLLIQSAFWSNRVSPWMQAIIFATALLSYFRPHYGLLALAALTPLGQVGSRTLDSQMRGAEALVLAFLAGTLVRGWTLREFRTFPSNRLEIASLIFGFVVAASLASSRSGFCRSRATSHGRSRRKSSHTRAAITSRRSRDSTMVFRAMRTARRHRIAALYRPIRARAVAAQRPCCHDDSWRARLERPCSPSDTQHRDCLRTGQVRAKLLEFAAAQRGPCMSEMSMRLVHSSRWACSSRSAWLFERARLVRHGLRRRSCWAQRRG